MEIENLLLNNHILNQIENDNAISPIYQIIDRKEEQKKYIINMIQNILKNQFDSRLLTLEKNTKDHFSVINNTLSTTKYITDLSLKIQKEIKEKQKKEKRNIFSKRSSKTTRRLNFSQNRFFTSKLLDKLSSKTPIRTKTNKGLIKSVNQSNNLLRRVQKDEYSKSPGYRMKGPRGINDNNENITKSPFSHRGFRYSINNKEKNNYNSKNNSPSPKKNYPLKKNISSKVNRRKISIIN